MGLKEDYEEWHQCSCDWCWGYMAAQELEQFFIYKPPYDMWLAEHPHGIVRH